MGMAWVREREAWVRMRRYGQGMGGLEKRKCEDDDYGHGMGGEEKAMGEDE